MRRLCASVLSILLALGWLTSPATIGAAQAAPAKPSVSPGHPVRGVAFTVAGKLTTKVARPVELQRKSGSKWVKIASGRTTSSGRYSFSASSSVSTAQLRVYAPKTKIGKKTYPKLTSKVNTVRTVAVTPSSPMAGETFTVVESLGKKGARPASLQRQSGKSWITLQTVKTSAAGTATFSTSLGASASLRVYAPKTKIKKKTYSKITVATFRVAISAQSGTLSLPSTGITGQALVAETQFTPARAGRTVELQQLSGASWVTVATSAQDAAGHATLGVAPSAEGTVSYRAISTGYQGAPAVSTSTSQASITSGVAEPSIVIGSLAPAVTGENYNLTLDVVGGTGPFTWTASGLPEGMSLSSDGALTGTPTTPGTYDITLSLTDSRGKSAQTSTQIVVRPVVGIESDSLPGAIAGQDYTATLAGTGGTTPYHWTADGLPAGLTISDDGVISGTTATEGTSQVTVTVTDANGKTATKEFTLATNAALALTTTSLPAGTVGADYSAALAAVGGASPYTWSQTGLPDGLSLNTTTGAITGTPTQAGTFDEVTITVTDDNDYTASATFSVEIAAAFAITTATLPNGVVDTAYADLTLTTIAGTAPFTWSQTGLPAGLSLDASTGVISGTPTEAGTFDAVTISVTDTNSKSAQADFSLTVAPAVHITTTTLPDGVVGTEYPETSLAAADGNGSSYFWAAANLPDGLALNGNTGVVSGVPTVAGQTDNVSITVTDEAGKTAEATLSITIGAAVRITTTSLPGGVVGTGYAQTTLVAVDGNGGPYTWSSTTLPDGLSLSTAGVITGTPTSAGVYDSVKITATDAQGATAEATFSVTIAQAVHITTASLPAGIVGTAYAETTLAAADGDSASYSWASTTLPAGLSLSEAGVLTGTPTTDGVYDGVKITVTDHAGKPAEATFTITIAKAVHITTTSLPTVEAGDAYPETTLTAADGTPGYTWSSTTLPAGLSLSETGVLTGTPTTDGTFDAVKITVTDHAGKTAEATFSITIAKAVHITTASLPAGVVGTAYTDTTLTAADGNSGDYTWASTTLPAGLSLSEAGVLTGTPTADGTFDAVKITVTDHAGKTAEATFSITIAKAVHITTTSLPDGVRDEAYPATTVTALDGAAPYTWSATGLPTGLALDPDTGSLSGTPTIAGTSDTVTITVTDHDGKTTEATFTITIHPVMAVTTASLAEGVMDEAYTATLSGLGGIAPREWALTGLPAGLSLNTATGEITGSPTESGTFDLVATLTDANDREATRDLSLTIRPVVQITTASVPAGVVGTDYSTSLTAAGGTTAYAWTSTTLPAGLSLTSAGMLSGTPTAAGSTTVTFTVTDDHLKTANVELSIAIAPAVHITTASLPAGVVGTTYADTQLAGADGNSGDYTWTSTTLPAGLELSTGGLLTGTPTADGVTTVTFTVTDHQGKTASAELSITIAKAVHITTASLPAGVVGTDYPETTLAAADGNGDYTWASTTLPDGLALSEAGVITGTPTADGTFDAVKITVTDHAGKTAEATFSITIAKAVHITTTSLPAGIVGTDYPETTLAASDGNSASYSWASTTLPAGLSLSAAGKITGTPITDGTFDAVKITVTDAAGKTAEATFSITIAKAVHITTASLPAGVVGTDYPETTLAAADGNNASYSWASTTLPAGLELSASGVLTGTPTTDGTFDAVKITVTDHAGKTAEATFSITIAKAVHITTAGLPAGVVGTSYPETTLTAADGNSASYSWASTTLPAGLSLSEAGVLTGTPTTDGTFDAVKITVTDHDGKTAEATFSITIAKAVHITTTSLPDGMAKEAYTETTLAAADGAPGYAWSSSTLPDGLALSEAGVLTGTPTTDGTTAVTFTVTDAGGKTATTELSITITAAAHLTNTALSIGVVGGDYTTTLTADGGTAPYTITANTLPAGLTLTDGVISGTPTAAGTNTAVELTVTDAHNKTATTTLGLTVVKPKTETGGNATTCAITPTGGIECWGLNSSGQIGDGTTTNRLYPVAVTDLGGTAISVSTGLNHTCAVLSNGTIRCWGSNANGQLGTVGTSSLTPVAIAGIDSAVTVEAGQSFTCATLGDGTASCWGLGTSGQIGNGSSSSVTTPTAVNNLTNLMDVEAGGTHACALTTSGTVSCWGRNQYRQLGAGAAGVVTSSNTPVAVPDVSGVVSLSTHMGAFTCAATNTGAVKCWGNNSTYQLGSTSVATSGDALTIADVTDAVTVVVGGGHACAINAAGALRCWGYNNYGQLGDGSLGINSATPVTVGIADPVASAAASTSSTCARTTTGTINCWGGNGSGQLGNGYFNSQPTPLSVPALTAGITSVGGGSNFSCALNSSGEVLCWGTNSYGQLGNSTTTSNATPGVVSDLGSGVTDLAVGSLHACAVTAAGGVKCWGRNNSGQLGDETLDARSVPVDVHGLSSGVIAISAGSEHTCALTDAGAVQCWGDNSAGQLGDDSSTDRPTPVGVYGLSSGVTAISAGAYHTCALVTGGGVRCWGTGNSGELGNGTANSDIPVIPTGMDSGVTTISAGLAFTCAVTDTGAAKCWGSNGYGQIGDGTTTAKQDPTDVTGLSSGVAGITAGGFHTCAAMTTGAVKCWGNNASGQLGNGLVTTNTNPNPVDVVGLTEAIGTVDTGEHHTCAITSAGGGLTCWGAGQQGQLGQFIDRNPNPAPVTGFNVAALAAGTANPPAGVVGTTYTSGQLSATGGVAPYAWTATGLPAGLSINTDGSLTGTPTADGTSEVTLTVTDVRGKTASTTASITIGKAVHITTDTSLPGGVVGTAYSTQLTAADGTGPYTWASDVVPAGLTLSQDGLLSGTPTAVTPSTTMQITATDANGKTDTQAFTIVITPVIQGVSVLSGGPWTGCVITGSGGAECWGRNDLSQLGNGTTTVSAIPVQVSDLTSGVQQIVSGASHSCALTEAGGVKCWGTNALGQLGNGTGSDSATPVDVPGLTSGVTSIATSTNHTCAITTAGALKCWGYNSAGQLGDGTLTNRSTPIQVPGFTSGVTQVVASSGSTCVLVEGGVSCWGSNIKGQLGDGSLDSSSTPVAVSGLSSGVSALSIYGKTACALTTGGAVKCWGYNASGQLGNESTDDSSVPVDVSGLDSGVKQISAGVNHVCALTNAGGTKCWGDNTYGELGNDSTTGATTPVDVQGLTSGVASIEARNNSTCALTTTGYVKCWGTNTYGQLGNGTTATSLVPVDVFGYGPVALRVATSGLRVGEVGISYPETAVHGAGGTAPYTWAATGLPAGLSINASTGVISGTPTETGTFNAVTITLTDGTNATAQTTLSVTTIAGVRVTTDSLPTGLVGSSYSATPLAAADGAAPYVWSATGLPAGLSLDANTGVISGTPTINGIFSVAITSTDNYGYAATTTIPLSVLGVAGVASDLTSIDGGGLFTCAVNNVGGVECWGYNTQGQLGNGTTTTSFSPVNVTGLASGVAAVTAANSFACALTNAGGVKCWGFNTQGQLGNGTTANSATPVDVDGLTSGVTAITAGTNFACALTNAGGVKCWGYNVYGQLGNTNNNNSTTPVDVDGLTSGVTDLAAGLRHACAVTTAGGVKCWGYNYYGQLGNGATNNTNAPVDVTDLTSGATSVTSGSNHSCALTTSGGIKCWGYNSAGQLGNATTTNASTPVDVTGISSGATSVTGGTQHTCALTAGGAKCWGYNSSGQLGIGTTANSTIPVDVTGLTSGTTAIAAGGNHTCAINSSHDVACWGENSYGQLGNGQSSVASSPVTGSGLASGLASAAAGYNHGCALTTGGGIKCWGSNSAGQLGNGTTTTSSTAVEVTGLSSGITAVALGGSHSCALTTGGGVKCWGSNGNGQLGNATTTDSSTPVDVSGLASGVTAITAGGSHTCALTTTGGIKCWGNNFAGAVGNGTMTDSYTPVDVSGLTSGVTAITAGGSHTCALTTTGGIKCWGYNETGELGNGTTTASSTPVDVDSLTSGATAVDAGGSETCALTADGGVECWGYNGYGQLGNGTTANSGTPVNVSGLSTGVTAINVGGYHACAVTSTGGSKCWGLGTYGQLGNGATTSSSTPVDVTGLASDVATVVGGNQHTCAVTTDGALKCWGYNSVGQLGNGDVMTLLPGAVVGHTFTPTS